MLNLSRCEINCNRILTTSDAIAPPTYKEYVLNMDEKMQSPATGF